MAYPRRQLSDRLPALPVWSCQLGSYYYIAPVILSILLLLNFNIQYYIVCGWFWFDEKNGYAGLKLVLTRKLKNS